MKAVLKKFVAYGYEWYSVHGVLRKSSSSISEDNELIDLFLEAEAVLKRLDNNQRIST